MKIPTILAVSLAAVLASSLLLAGPFSIGSIFPAKHDDHVQEAEAQALPLVVRDRFTEKQMAGDALRVDEEFVDPENHCEFCTRVEYVPGPQGAAGFSYEDVTGVDLTGAKKVRFWVMGEEGNEKIKFKLAGKSLDKIQDKLTGKPTKDIFKTERFALTTEEVTLDDDWKKYEVDLSGVDLKGITHPFGFELSENDAQQVLYIKGVVYDEEPAVDALATVEEELIEGLTAEIISNGTEGTAPATFEFDANVTGGAEPYFITWDFDDDSEDEGQNVIHTFAETGEYNVTVAATDAGGQNASGSVVIQVAEPGIVEEGMDNSTSTDTNATSAQGETNATGSVEQQATAESIQADAGINVVAQPGDTVVLGGEIAGIDTEIEDLSLAWTQTSGPTVEINGAELLHTEIAIPDLEDDAEIQLQFAASLGSAEDSDTVTVFVEHVDEIEGAQEESLDPVDSAVTEWADECDDLADCMGDNSDDTFAAASPEDVSDVNLFSFEEFDVDGNDVEIEYVTAIAKARTDGTGYLLFAGADSSDAQDRSEAPGAVSIASDSFQEYEYVWEENPVTNSPWAVDSLNSFLAGYAYGDGGSDIEVSEFSLAVTYTAEEPAAASRIEQIPDQSGNTTVTNSTSE